MKKSIILLSSIILCLFSLSANAKTINENTKETVYEMSIENQNNNEKKLVLYERIDHYNYSILENQLSKDNNSTPKCSSFPRVKIIYQRIRDINWSEIEAIEPTTCLLEIYVEEDIIR